MFELLRCPSISIENLSKYLEYSNKCQQYSNFGYCENLLKEKLSKALSVPINNTCLGSSATSLLEIACSALMEQKSITGNIYFPVFSFFSTFSIASRIQKNITWFDVNPVSFLPKINTEIRECDLLYMNIPFGQSSKIDEFFLYAKKLPCFVIIDAAACLPGLIFKKMNLKKIPPNVIIVFSLHATKLLSCGEGGLCISGTDAPENIKRLTNFGIDEQRNQKWPNSFNAKMSEFNAAAGLSSLEDFENNALRILKAKQKAKQICSKYNINFFGDETEPTLTMNIKVKNNNNFTERLALKGYVSRRWWSLSKSANIKNHIESINLYHSLIGVPFDWEHIDIYFDSMCQGIDVLKK